MSVVQLFYPRLGQEDLAETLRYIDETGRNLNPVLLDGVVSIETPREIDPILYLLRDERTGRYHSHDAKCHPVAEGPTLRDALRGLASV
jgi:hypothetical protein